MRILSIWLIATVPLCQKPTEDMFHDVKKRFTNEQANENATLTTGMLI